MAEPDVAPMLRRTIEFYEALRPEHLAQIAQLYAADARFRDPFNDVRGTAAIEAIFARMFTQLAQPRFLVRDAVAGDARAFLTWDFEFRFRRGDTATVQRIHGATLLRFDAAGRISEHRDYWDAAGELYEKLPVLGPPMRWLRRRVGH